MAFGSPPGGKGQILTPPSAPSAIAQPVSGTVYAVQSLAGAGYTMAGSTGLVAAAITAGSSVFAMRMNTGSVVGYIDRLRLSFTTITGFLAPITNGRALGIYRGSGASPSGGTSMSAVKKDTASASSALVAAAMASTGALTVAGITFETTAIRTLPLASAGTAGAFEESEYVFDYPLVLRPGEVLAIQNPVTMDLAGVWQMTVNVDWHEA